MEKFGIYTLANDVVYDQLIALINSIEKNVGSDIPICIIPYDRQLQKVTKVVDSRKNVTLFADETSIQYWEGFYNQVWEAHPQAPTGNQKTPKNWKKTSKLFRKMCAYDGNFESFVFYDADSLAMSSLDKVITKLDEYDFVFDDWEHDKPIAVTALKLDIVEKQLSLQEPEIRKSLHCSSFFGSKKGIFGQNERKMLLEHLIDLQELTWINDRSWGSDAYLFTYMTLRCDRPIFNFTLSPNPQDRTGNCADADPFVNIDNILYNQQGLKPILRLHYMNYSSIQFKRLCQGEDIDMHYKDEFLYYRYLNEPQQKPQELKPPNLVLKTNRAFTKAINKVKNKIFA